MGNFYRFDKNWINHVVPSKEPEHKILRQSTQNTIKISSVFLGVDHNFINGIDDPILFETMVFFGNRELQYRFRTYKEIMKAHDKLVSIYLDENNAGFTDKDFINNILKVAYEDN